MGQVLVGPDGSPISSKQFKRATPPKLGEAFGARWSDANFDYYQLPGGGVLQFDLSRLTLADFRLMKDHYQVNASLSVLSFMMHQLDWKIECDNERIRKHCQENMDRIWTRLVRGLSQSFWAGYSPNVLQWENDLTGKTIQLTKIKDLVPDECCVNWKYVEGWAPPDKPKPKIAVYDGIKQYGGSYPIPTENSLWYPLLMENGDYYGRKLLRPAFTSWFFSIMIHLFSNRYFERFGQPVPVGRAPYEDEIDIAGKKVPAMTLMSTILQNFRSGSNVVLPSERSVVGTQTEYDYAIEYLESQMRGADFERYLMRLDEEISLAMFTPLLMLRTADVGSYNLGTQHSLVYMQMLNALAGDWAQYINDYILSRMVDFNFSPTSPRATIKFRKLGDDKLDLVKTILQALLTQNKVMPDLLQLSDIAGLTLEEVEELGVKIEPDGPPAPSEDDNSDDKEVDSATGETKASRRAAEAIYRRVEGQIHKANRDGTVGAGFVPDIGYKRQYVAALTSEGISGEVSATTYAAMSAWVVDLTSVGIDSFGGTEECLSILKKGIYGITSGAKNGVD